jgi:hypothetical protein
MRTLGLGIGLVVYLTVFGQAAFAQTPSNTLRGLREVKVDVDLGGPDEDTRRCGLDEESLRRVFIFPLASIPLQVVPKENTTVIAFVTISVSALLTNNNAACVGTLDIKMYTFEDFALRATRTTILATIKLWHRGSLYSTARANFAEAIRKDVELFGKELAVDWLLDQK